MPQPIAWVYPTGKQQETRVARAPQHYHWAEVIAGGDVLPLQQEKREYQGED